MTAVTVLVASLTELPISLPAADFDLSLGMLVGFGAIGLLGFAAVALGAIVRNRVPSRSEQPAATAPDGACSSTLQIGGALATLVPVFGFFGLGFCAYLDSRTPPRDAIEVTASADGAKWQFTYPGSLQANNLHVPVDTPVRLLLASKADTQALALPALRLKGVGVGGRPTELWFQANRLGEGSVQGDGAHGLGGTTQPAKLFVHSTQDFDAWLGELRKAAAPLSPIDLGKQLYEKQVCKTCHTLDGSKLVGPSWKGLFGRKEKLTDGTSVLVDEAYLQESMLEPSKKVVEGYAPAMPSYQGKLSDADITALVEYIKTLK